jgi:hypothetical protein
VSTVTKATSTRIVKAAVWLTLLDAWVLFEEVVVDRVGVWKYMPLYRVGAFCTWDAAATIVISLIVSRAFRMNAREVLSS